MLRKATVDSENNRAGWTTTWVKSCREWQRVWDPAVVQEGEALRELQVSNRAMTTAGTTV